ncbi:MAG: hypothetical protein HON14_02535 [Rhodospirillaceae bacterium]|jgi:hypothetical protein|nr:hypothetical protein [Rhodospirillaceae bacterium]MBT4589076.1 hypothetical protein [Rhodospirillaceae bacterium]MBT4937981.1 hypothetical protein [Rhodospirillaceae bacterium]MBT5940905.1 hypothetical protein [Rhodospirillaceae bacterium]MBT7265721.1 hypothetical protein [Rhodospirillaceae bacterium]
MAFAIVISKELNCVFIRHEGQMAVTDIPASFDEILAHPDFKKGMNILRDSTNAIQPQEYDFNFFQRESPGRLGKYEPFFGKCKLAWVISNPKEFAIVHRYTIARRMSDDLMERHPFNTIQAAIDWLGLPADSEIPI